ncbi:hypothetical protein [Prosthecobacter dejongeii]|uniref:Uncharacterized protein n=1 Tax=Prosthecobacter dejongeii TaxID=48465 RepID=A0A7W7YGX9_9BACT|nr:hypothetical protein [Prosthecobacter dejongeii]MBB5035947.1 hypothetical protein [Prosthecobacter dejongeii]
MLVPEILICLGIGILSGVVAALCGVGGGVVMVPAFLLLLDMPQSYANAGGTGDRRGASFFTPAGHAAETSRGHQLGHHHPHGFHGHAAKLPQ